MDAGVLGWHFQSKRQIHIPDALYFKQLTGCPPENCMRQVHRDVQLLMSKIHVMYLSTLLQRKWEWEKHIPNITYNVQFQIGLTKLINILSRLWLFFFFFLSACFNVCPFRFFFFFPSSSHCRNLHAHRTVPLGAIGLCEHRLWDSARTADRKMSCKVDRTSIDADDLTERWRHTTMQHSLALSTPYLSPTKQEEESRDPEKSRIAWLCLLTMIHVSFRASGTHTDGSEHCNKWGAWVAQ